MTIYNLQTKKGPVNVGQKDSLVGSTIPRRFETDGGGVPLPAGEKKGRLGHSAKPFFPGGSKNQPGNAGSDAPGVNAEGVPGDSTFAGCSPGSNPGRPGGTDGLRNSGRGVSDCGTRKTSGSGAEPQGTPSLPYKDSFANRATFEASSRSKSTCKKYMVIGQCEHEDMTLVKVLYCGQEWCPDCGQDWSVVHQRRFSRLLPKAMQLAAMGYLVIEWPDRYRHTKGRVYSAKGLRQTADVVVDVLAGARKGRRGRVGGYFSRAMVRWHFYGEKRPGKWNPHLNILTESGHIEDYKLDAIKAHLRESLNCPDLIVHYEYTSNVHKMIHLLKYVTRATFLNRDWDNYMANELFGFRNIRSWGKWDGEPVWGAEGQEFYLGIAKMESGKCPKCGGHLTWSKPVDSHPLDDWVKDGKAEALGGGYFAVDVGQYAGNYRGVDVVEVVDGATGELVPVENTVLRRKLLRGDYEALERMVKMTERRVKYVNECRALGIDWRDEATKYESEEGYWGS